MATMLNTSRGLWEITTSSVFFTTEYDYSDIEFSEPCDSGTHASHFLPVLYSLFYVAGVLGNMLVLWVILMSVQMKSMTDVSLLNLAIADLLLTFSLPFLAHYARDTWVFGRVMCTLVLSVYYIGFYGGIFFIVLMSIDRYLAVVHTMFALRVRTKTYGILASVVIWIIAIAASFPELLYLGAEENRTEEICSAYPKNQESDVRSAAFFKMNVLGMLIPLIIVGFCYSMILRKLWTLRTTFRTVRLVTAVTVVFFCCWIPYNIAAFLKAWELKQILPPECEHSKTIQLMLQVTEAIAYSHSCLNPFLYVFVGQKFRRNLADLLKTPCVKVQYINRYVNWAKHTVCSYIYHVDECSIGI
ncbi:hypothetical protein AMELA_G00072650 [Ameiurus melas]|uniref:G-protein coupled receptors family 1 profile domain-containing protein n=1 Tax=Ameiurus melas TaxID=219545 RepID=A0A7J6AXK4_AMEME|nr:hypothetical protein AMELA_G00072650 [Ameiurus melas]